MSFCKYFLNVILASADVPLAVAAGIDGDVAAEVQHERLQRPARGHRREHSSGAKTTEF